MAGPLAGTSSYIERKAFAQESRNTLVVVVADDCRGGGLDTVIGIGRRIAFISRLEHAQIIVAVAEANDAFNAKQVLHHRDCATFAGVAVMHIEPAPMLPFKRNAGVSDKVRLVVDAAEHRLDGFAVSDGVNVRDCGVGRQCIKTADLYRLFGANAADEVALNARPDRRVIHGGLVIFVQRKHERRQPFSEASAHDIVQFAWRKRGSAGKMPGLRMPDHHAILESLWQLKSMPVKNAACAVQGAARRDRVCNSAFTQELQRLARVIGDFRLSIEERAIKIEYNEFHRERSYVNSEIAFTLGELNLKQEHEKPVSPWPQTETASIAFLLDVRDDFEAGLLRDWVESQRPETSSPYSFTNLADAHADDRLAVVQDLDDKVWMQPLRIAWLPPSREAGSRLLRDLLYGRMTKPGKLRRWWLARNRPDRFAHVVGDGAYLGDLRERHAGTASVDTTLSEFVAGQAMIALERSERSLRGARYKVPRILQNEVFANADFQNHIADIAQQRDRTVASVREQAGRYLQEMAAAQTPSTLDMIYGLYRTACRSHHDAEINVDNAQIERIAELLGSRPVVFLISHKSMLDTMALSIVLYERNLPLPLTFGGINLNTPGLGAIARRSGIIFLRRAFQDNTIYKATFRRYIDYLIEKRFSLLWALEGTRSRTGKLLPPRFGLFSYVFESIMRTRLHDVTFVPVSVAYDQITEVEDYSIEQRGQKKKPETITWPLRFLRRGRSRGQIHLRFGEALTVRDLVEPGELDAHIDAERKKILVPTLAFEVAVRMNAATPITATAIVTLILLAGGNRAQSLDEIQTLSRAGAALIRKRHLEIVGRSNFRDADAVLATLEELHQTGIVTYLDEGTERLYQISADQHHNAAYYRNTAIHYFILDAVVEIALLDAAGDPEDPREAFFTRANELRELFKFEFYFPRQADYRSEVEARVRDRFHDWEDIVRSDTSVRAGFNEVQLLIAHAVLRSFVDAYRIMASVLAAAGSDAVKDQSAFLTRCLKTGKQGLLQGRVFSPESISKSLYATGLKLADYRGLLAANEAEARNELHGEFRRINGRLDEILAITLAKAEGQ